MAVDVDGRTLAIRRSLAWARREDVERDGDGRAPYGEGRRPVFGPPKTESSRRTLPLAPELASSLKAWRLQCPKGAENLVFSNLAGGPTHRSFLIKGLREALGRCPETRGTWVRFVAQVHKSALPGQFSSDF